MNNLFTSSSCHFNDLVFLEVSIMSRSSIIVDPEEGEIIDDDFDEISDNSIILNETGKSLSLNEHLPVISLSSVSDMEVDSRMCKMKRFKRLHGYRHHHAHHHHHHHKGKRKMKEKYFGKNHKKKWGKWKRFVDSSSSSYFDSDNESSLDLELDRKLQSQLKAAIRVQTPADGQKNSLKTRLKAMKQVNNEIKSSSPKSDRFKESSEELDNELIQLRLEALKTAVLNKLEHRKKRKVKELQDNEVIKTNTLETNKENTGNENIQCKKHCLEEPDINTTPPEEDEDVLRALLLASMSKKITKENENQKAEVQEINSKSNQIMFTNRCSAPLRQHIPTIIKPIIININSGSETDDDKINTTPTEKEVGVIKSAPISKNNREIESTVEKFLKEQRAKVEAELVLKNPAVPQVCTQHQTTKPKTKSNNSLVLEKSAVMLLPKVKQIEYRKLLQKLKNAQRKPQSRKASFRSGEEGNSVRKIIKNKESPAKLSGINIIGKVTDIKQDARILHCALKQMQSEKNGREIGLVDAGFDEGRIGNTHYICGIGVLQTVCSVAGIYVLNGAAASAIVIEEKYVVLTPTIRKINEATTERKKYDQEVKSLLSELSEAKAKLQITHQNFSTLVRELLQKKEEIDKSAPQKTIMINGEMEKLHTSACNNIILPSESLDMSTILNIPNSVNPIPTSTISIPTSTPIPTSNPIPTSTPISKPWPTFSSLIFESKLANPTSNNMESLEDEKQDYGRDNEKIIPQASVTEVVRNGNNTGNSDVDEFNPGDPNDIHRIYKKCQSVPKYVSPLDSNNRDVHYDPFVIMCPYDINGNCRDSECIYKHYHSK